MSSKSKLFFSGLCVLAPEGVVNNKATNVSIYLVDARMPKKSCKKKLLLSAHRPLLSFDPADRLSGSTKQPDEIIPAPDGGEIHLCRLDLESVTIRSKGGVTLDADFNNCVPSLKKIDHDMDRLRASEAVAKVTFLGGTLCPVAPSPDKWKIGGFENPLANGVKLELAGGLEIRFEDGEMLKLKDGAKVNVSNLPSHPPKKHDDELPHFLWYYRLAGWKSGCQDHVPKKKTSTKRKSKRKSERDSRIRTAGSGICPQSQWP